ncbi:IS110 family transposase [Bradyrhizobium sp. ISRA435]|nr:IS110 family transposase [Bradyrhizobium sp. ISRA435]
MYHYAGIDVSLESSSVCVVDGAGKILREAKVASEPEALIAWFRSLGQAMERIGLEAGPLSQWLSTALRAAGLAVELLETRHVRDAFKAMPVKSDRNDARGIAQLMRLGWFRPVHCKSIEAQETRAVLTARKLLQSKLRDIENSVRGVLRGFGLKVGKTTERTFANRIRELVAGHPGLELVAQALLEAHAVLLREFNGLDRHTQKLARSHPPGPASDDNAGRRPDRGAHLCRRDRRSGSGSVPRRRPARILGSPPKKYQSGQTDYTARISKIGDASVREALYQAAHVMLTKPVRNCSALKSWAMRLAKRAGMRKAKVALARKLAVILHRMLADAKPFNPMAHAT